MIIGEDFDSVFLQLCKKIKSKGKFFSPRTLETKELIFEPFVITNPLKCILSNSNRKISEKYIYNEIKWYISGDLNIDKIKDHSKMWATIQDKDGKINSNYGYYVYIEKTPENVSQFDYVIDKLSNDIDSRQAIININNISHKYDTKDFPCTISIQFIIRDDKLSMIVNMRSTDIIYGLSNDVPAFVFFMKHVFDKLSLIHKNLSIGNYYHVSASLHIYKRHFNMLNNIISDNKLYESEYLNFNAF